MERRFARELHALGECRPETFLPDPRVVRAAILLFDQVPRNLYRDSALAWAWDGLARDLARAAIARGVHRGLSRAEAQFVAMPLMHSEDIADQNASTAFFARHGDAHTLRFARAHRARWSRASAGSRIATKRWGGRAARRSGARSRMASTGSAPPVQAARIRQLYACPPSPPSGR